MEVPKLGGQIGAVAAGLHYSHSNARSELHLPPTPVLVAMTILNPLMEARSNQHSHRHYVRFLTRCNKFLQCLNTNVPRMQNKITYCKYYEFPFWLEGTSKNTQMRSSHCSATGSVAPLEHWDTSSIPGLAQWIKDLQCQNCSSDLIPGCCQEAKKEKKEKKENINERILCFLYPII